MVYSDPKSLDGLEDEEKKPSKCPDCGSKDIVYDKGERFCKKCGYVFD
jgi:ribosomal protein S27AE